MLIIITVLWILADVLLVALAIHAERRLERIREGER